MSEEPRVSVILPSYNRLAHLRAAVGSVLAQTCRDFELLIADDGSDEATLAWLAGLADPRIRVLQLAHSGAPSVARNAAIRAARGRYIAFLDSDDVWLPQKLERQLAFMAERACAWSYHACGRIDAGGNAASWAGVRPWQGHEGDIVAPLLAIEALIATPTVMAERSLVARAGGFDEAQRFCEDYDLWLRLALAAPAGALAERLADVRVHDDNLSRDRLGAHLGWVRLYDKMQALVGDVRLRALCRQQHARAVLSVALARWHGGQGGGALRDLARAAREGWRFAAWWRDLAHLARRRLRITR